MKKHKGKAQGGETLARPNTDALQDGGLLRSSDEAPVMGVERRAEVTQLRLPLTTPNKREMVQESCKMLSGAFYPLAIWF